MSKMSKVIFNYKGNEMMIQCEYDKKINEIIKNFEIKSNIEKDKVCYFYNGNLLEANKDSKLEDLINLIDKERNKMNILVNDINEKVIYENIIKAKEIICPECKEPIYIKIDNYKFHLNNCKNGHKISHIQFDEFENTQKIDISKIKCNLCDKNMSNSYQKTIYICLNCNINLCPLCKEKHNKEHKIYNYELKNYICNLHYQHFVKYCKECKRNICIDCEKEHKNHNIIYY